MTKQDVLKQYFGYDTFRGGQEEIIDALLAGRDVLAVTDAPAVLNDLALEAMAKKEYDKAVQLLEYSKVTFSDSTLLNTLGVAYAGAGEPYKAEDAFRRAAEAGVEEARHNLTQVQGVIEQL